MTKKSEQKFKNLKNKKNFSGEIKSVFIILKGLLVARNCMKPESVPFKVSLTKYVDMFPHDCGCNIRFIFISTKQRIFRILKNQNIPNTPSMCLNFSFSAEGFSNLNCLQGMAGRSR